MRILVLDDDEIRHDQFKVNLEGHSVVHVHTAEEAGTALAAEKFDLAYLDHDPQDFQPNPSGYGVMEQTGFDVARYIARYLAPHKRPAKVIVHSWNAAGAHRMVAELREAGILVAYEPFGGHSGKAQKFAKPGDAQLTEADDPNWVMVAKLDDMTPERVKKIRDQFHASINSMQNLWRTPIFTGEPTNLVELKEIIDNEFPPERPSKCMAESKAAQKNRRELDDGAFCEECLDDVGRMLECGECLVPLCETCHDGNYGYCENCGESYRTFFED